VPTVWKLWEPQTSEALRAWPGLYLQIFPTKTASSPCMLCAQPINAKLRNDTNKLVTVVTIRRCKTATQFRPCQSQRTATSVGNKPHSPTAGTLFSSPQHHLLLLSVSTRMLQNVPRSPPSKLLPTHNLRPPSFSSSDTAVPFEKLTVAQTFKKLPILSVIQSSISVHTRLHR